jgi:hypothetical protein
LSGRTCGPYINPYITPPKKKGKQEKVHNVFTTSKDPICPRFIAKFLATKYALEKEKKTM